MKKYFSTIIAILMLCPLLSQNIIHFEYDNLGRLSKQITSNGITVTYSYDELGNRTNKKVVKIKSDIIRISDNKLSIFPNPVKDILHIIIENNQDIHYSIFTTVGIKVAEGNLDSHEKSINVSLLQRNTYILKLQSDKVLYTKFFIKE